jgi:methionine synthase I (cobalamin-dependent)
MSSLRDKLKEDHILIADGATGTFLQAAGLPAGAVPERWNLENPDAIRKMHAAYVEAGADLILTNTFGGNRFRLGRDGLGDRVAEINAAAVHLAKEAAGSRALVLGDIGPTGELMEPMGKLTHETAVAAFSEQAAALAAAGADGILIETMSDLDEAKAAVEAVQRVTQLPLLVTFSFDTRGRTMMGVDPVRAAETIWAMGVDAVGANCGRTLSENLEAITKMRQALPQATLMVKPNAGLPHIENQEIVYDVTPEIMAEYAHKFAAQGVKVLGGCCGSTPEHIKAVVATLKG